MLSPLVHVIELNHSPKSVRRTRKRRSSETAEAIITSSDTEKTPVFHPPSIENEINYLPNLINKKIKVIPVTPVTHPDELPFFTPVTSFRKNPYRVSINLLCILPLIFCFILVCKLAWVDITINEILQYLESQSIMAFLLLLSLSRLRFLKKKHFYNQWTSVICVLNWISLLKDNY